MTRRNHSGTGGPARGSALPAVLVLLAVMLQLATAANRATLDGTRVAASLRHAALAAALADRHIAAALRSVRATPASLPVGATVALAGLTAPTGSSRATLAHTGNSACTDLAPLTGARDDYEIRATAVTTRARNHQRQGFYVCREVCAAPCIGTATDPVATYRVTTREDR